LLLKKIYIVIVIISFVLLTGCSTNFNSQHDVDIDSQFFKLQTSTQMATIAPFKIEKQLAYPVLRRGLNKSWDSVDLLNPSVIFSNGRYYNYYSGYNGKTWSTGVATSSDGVKWEKYNKPILQPDSYGWDSKYIAANGSAIAYRGKTYYYYQGESSSNITQIGLAISANHIQFNKYNKPVLRVGSKGSWDDQAVGDPYVMQYEGQLYMYYLGMNSLGIQRIGVAKSTNGLDWVKYPYPILALGVNGSFDENGLGEPSVVYYPPFFYMLYTGRSYNEVRDIGLAISLDGVNWRKLNTYGLFDKRKSNSWDDAVITDTTLILNNKTGQLKIWYGGGDKRAPAQNLNGNVGYMTASISQDRNMSIFDPNANWNKSLVKSTDVLSGSYPIEGTGNSKYVWITNHANVTLLKQDSSKGIELRGYIPFSIFQKAYPNLKNIAVSVAINGKLMKTAYADSKNQAIDIRLTNQDISGIVSNNSFYDLSVNVSKEINPYLQGINKDRRTLSMIINYIGVY
jgi:predicted GH43/DUF377 family glycosyl hydrolase